MQNSILTKGYRAAANIAAHSAVMLNSNGEITTATAHNSAVIGVSGELDATNGEMTDVIHAGIAEVQLSGTVAAGDSLSPSGSGKVKKSSSNHRRIGLALEKGVNGERISALIIPVDVI